MLIQIFDFYKYNARHISFSILLKIKAMVGESRVSNNRGEVERKDDNDNGNFINILVVTIIIFSIVFINNIKQFLCKCTFSMDYGKRKGRMRRRGNNYRLFRVS